MARVTEQPRPQRVRVTGPGTSTRRPSSAPTAAREIDAQTDVGAVFVRSLLRAQLRVATRTLLWLVLLVGSLPLAFHLWPSLARRNLLGMPLAWGSLAFVVYPVLIALAWGHIRRAERTERDFADVVEGPQERAD